MTLHTLLHVLAATLSESREPGYASHLAGGVEAMWQVPESPVAILFLAHGCSHSATDFWPPTPKAPKALGLPEEVRLVRAALSVRLAVIAISSSDRDVRCWDFESDGPRVKDALTAFRAARSELRGLPLVAMGASSGGAFVLQLPALVPVAAVVSQIMAIPPHLLPQPMPPTLFVHMPRDRRTASLVHKCVHHLKQQGVAADQLEIAPQRPTADFFLQRIVRIDASTARSLHGALQKGGLLDDQGYLSDDPRRTAWREAVSSQRGLLARLPGPGAGGPPDSLVSDQSAVSEALNVAWAAHEIVSDAWEGTLHWLTTNATPALASVRFAAAATISPRHTTTVEAATELRA